MRGDLTSKQRKVQVPQQKEEVLLPHIAATCLLGQLPKGEYVKLTPHMLRHTFLKRVADKHGVHYAQRLSGNVSIREVFRYTKPSDEEVEEDVEKLFD